MPRSSLGAAVIRQRVTAAVPSAACSAFDDAAEDEGRDAGSLGRELQPLRRRGRILADLADDAGKPGVAQAFLHREQDVGVAARLDMDHAVGMQAGEVERRREQVAPPQAPEHRAFDPREDAGEEDRRAGVVGEVGAAGYLVQRAGRDPAARQARIERVDAERDGSVPRARALDPRDARAQIFEDDGLVHGIGQTRERVDSFLVCSIRPRSCQSVLRPADACGPRVPLKSSVRSMKAPTFSATSASVAASLFNSDVIDASGA